MIGLTGAALGAVIAAVIVSTVNYAIGQNRQKHDRKMELDRMKNDIEKEAIRADNELEKEKVRVTLDRDRQFDALLRETYLRYLKNFDLARAAIKHWNDYTDAERTALVDVAFDTHAELAIIAPPEVVVAAGSLIAAIGELQKARMLLNLSESRVSAQPENAKAKDERESCSAQLSKVELEMHKVRTRVENLCRRSLGMESLPEMPWRSS